MSLLDENAAILAGFVQDGSDLTLPRLVDFSHLFPDRASAEAFATSAADDGWQTALTEPDRNDDPWDVTATKEMQPSAVKITVSEERLDALARAHGGCSDGWGFFRT